jgi:hypothetical protein
MTHQEHSFVATVVVHNFLPERETNMRIVPLVGALLLVSSVALAQQKPANPDANTPAVATPNTKNPNAPVEGANSFTEGQARSRIEAAGFSNVTNLQKTRRACGAVELRKAAHKST